MVVFFVAVSQSLVWIACVVQIQQNVLHSIKHASAGRVCKWLIIKIYPPPPHTQEKSLTDKTGMKSILVDNPSL